MNEIGNKLLLAWDTFMPEIHLKQSRFTYSASRHFTKNKIRMEKVREKTRFKIYLSKQVI